MTCVAEITLEQLEPSVELQGIKWSRGSGQCWVVLGRSKPEERRQYKAGLSWLIFSHGNLSMEPLLAQNFTGSLD